MGIYVGVNGTPKEVTAVYVGVNGVPKECSDIYVGVNGTPKPCYSGVKPGETVFTSSTNFTVPRGVKKIDCFCVGGGGGGSAEPYRISNDYTNYPAGSRYCKCGNLYVEWAACSSSTTFHKESDWKCGCGGQCVSSFGQSVTPKSAIPIVVGAGSSSFSGSSSSIGSICNANGGDAWGGTNYAKGKWAEGEEWYESSYVNGDKHTCPKCGDTIYTYSNGGWEGHVTTRSASFHYNAEAGQYAFGDTSRGLYGCGGGYRTESANSGDGKCGSANSGICIVKWDGK